MKLKTHWTRLDNFSSAAERSVRLRRSSSRKCKNPAQGEFSWRALMWNSKRIVPKDWSSANSFVHFLTTFLFQRVAKSTAELHCSGGRGCMGCSSPSSYCAGWRRLTEGFLLMFIIQKPQIWSDSVWQGKLSTSLHAPLTFPKVKWNWTLPVLGGMKNNLCINIRSKEPTAVAQESFGVLCWDS